MARGIPRWLRQFATTVVAVLLMAVGLSSVLASAHASTVEIPGGVADPTANEITPMCDTTTPATAVGPATAVPSSPVSTLVHPAGGVVNFSIATTTAYGTEIYVNTGTAMDIYSTGGTLDASFALDPNLMQSWRIPSQPVVDPSGNIYLSSYYGQVVNKYSRSGSLIWSVDPLQGNPVALFSTTTSGTFNLMVSLTQNRSGSSVLDPANGAVTGSIKLYDDFGHVSQEANGDLLYANDWNSNRTTGYVTTWDPTGMTVLSTFGSANIKGNNLHIAGGTQFYYPSAAVQGPDGTIYTADPLSTIEATNPNGNLEGTTTLGGNLNMGEGELYLVGNTFYVQGGPPFYAGADTVSTFTLASLQAYLNAPHNPTNSLGWGAGLSTPVTDNYFAPGTTPSATATFDAWWLAEASHLTLTYTVRDQNDMKGLTTPQSTTVPLPTTAPSGGGNLSIPLTIPATDTQPGPYQIQAVLTDTSTNPPSTLGTTCMPYTVGATGDGLNFSSLPGGADAGGPSDSRGVALNAQLGLNGQRGRNIVWSSVLPNCNFSAPTATNCGAAAINTANLPTDPFTAAAEAQANHVAYWIQVSNGDSASMGLVNGGFWQQDVAAIVRFYATVPAGCSPCAPVTAWEPWNEPNATGWNSGATYTTSVLAPFYNAVKSVEPGTTSTVVGGSTLGVASGWWSQLVNAGGLHDLDAAGIHPYTGSNDSWTEDQMPAQVATLQTLVAPKPVWFTEVGWWNNGDYNYLAQANNVAQAMVWMKALHIPAWYYYYDEGNGIWSGTEFPMIEMHGNYVNPSALASMTAASETASRPYLGLQNTGIPHVFDAGFGASTGGGDPVQAVFSDGLATNATVTATAPGGGPVPVTVTTQYGATTTTEVPSGTPYALAVSDSVSYVSAPAGDTITVGATEAYGTNLALATSGATATATSGSAANAINGNPAGYRTGWTSGSGDATPTLTVTLAGTASVNRIIVDTGSVGSVAPSARNFSVSVNQPGLGWTDVGDVTGAFWNHTMQLAFPPVMASAIRITITEVNVGGYDGGGLPSWWSASTGITTAYLNSFEVYGGSADPTTVNGTGLPAIVPGTTQWAGINGTGGSPGPASTAPATPTSSTTPTTSAPPTTLAAPPTTSAPSTTSAPTASTPSAPNSGSGYRIVTRYGAVHAFGSASSYGATSGGSENDPVLATADTPDNQGFWLLTASGRIQNFGDAAFYGSNAGRGGGVRYTSIAATPDGKGYWILGNNGSVSNFGDAHFYGSTTAFPSHDPAVAIAATPDGNGYWLLSNQGRIGCFGDAAFYGSTGGATPNGSFVGMARTPDGKGYWMFTATGAVTGFGDARSFGSVSPGSPASPITGFLPTPDAQGYWMLGRNGTVYAFGDATSLGSFATPGTASALG